MTTTPDPFVHFDGAYVLGALDADDRAAFEAHLATCDACRARVEEVRPTAALLAGMTGADLLAEPVPMPDTLLPGLLRKAGVERTRRRWLTASLAAVAAACLIALVVVVWPSTKAAGPARQQLQAVQASPVRATAALVDRKWGTEIDLRCTYSLDSDGGAVPAVPYRLIVVDTSNKSYDAGSWTLVRGGTTTFTGGIAVPRDKIAKVQVTWPNGKPILQLTL
jgi:hypothetical protein